jgi:hypothetical protein
MASSPNRCLLAALINRASERQTILTLGAEYAVTYGSGRTRGSIPIQIGNFWLKTGARMSHIVAAPSRNQFLQAGTAALPRADTKFESRG